MSGLLLFLFFWVDRRSHKINPSRISHFISILMHDICVQQLSPPVHLEFSVVPSPWPCRVLQSGTCSAKMFWDSFLLHTQSCASQIQSWTQAEWTVVIISAHLLLRLRRCRAGGTGSCREEQDNWELESNTDYGLLELKESCELEGKGSARGDKGR